MFACSVTLHVRHRAQILRNRAPNLYKEVHTCSSAGADAVCLLSLCSLRFCDKQTDIPLQAPMYSPCRFVQR